MATIQWRRGRDELKMVAERARSEGKVRVYEGGEERSEGNEETTRGAAPVFIPFPNIRTFLAYAATRTVVP